MNIDLLLPIVEGIAVQAGIIASSHFASLQEELVTIKTDGSPLSAADLDVDAYISEQLRKQTDVSRILSEEGSEHQYLANGFCWIVDPIDGTRNFVQGDSSFAISIALVHDGIPILGVVHAPELQETYSAVLGGGANRNGAQIQVSACSDLTRAHIELDYGSHPLTVRFHAHVKQALLLAGSTTRNVGCASLQLAHVGCGVADAMIHRRLSAWDIAAGIVIAKEAGARIGNLDGGSKDLFAPGIVASTPEIFSLLTTITARELDAEHTST